MADIATAVAKLAEVLEKYYPVFEQYVRINQQNATAKTGQDQQMREETKSSEKGEKQDSKGFFGFFGSLYDTITSAVSCLYRQEESEYSRMTTLDPVKSGESEIKEFSYALGKAKT